MFLIVRIYGGNNRIRSISAIRHASITHSIMCYIVFFATRQMLLLHILRCSAWLFCYVLSLVMDLISFLEHHGINEAMFADGCVKDMMNQFPLLCNQTFVSSSL